MISNEQGNSLVEATIVFPLVILAVISLIYITAFIFEESASLAHVQIASVQKAGIQTDTYNTALKCGENMSTSDKQQGYHLVKKAAMEVDFAKRSLLGKSFQKEISSSKYVIDEKSEIRIIRFINSKIE